MKLCSSLHLRMNIGCLSAQLHWRSFPTTLPGAPVLKRLRGIWLEVDWDTSDK